MYIQNMTRFVGERLRHHQPGKVVKLSDKGDYQREIDKKGEELVFSYLKEKSDCKIAIKTEFSDEKWFLVHKNRITAISKREISQADVAIIVDEVEGTKNLSNDNRMTTFFTFDPHKPNMRGIIEAEIYKWNGSIRVAT